jgi:hypothetical protein
VIHLSYTNHRYVSGDHVDLFFRATMIAGAQYGYPHFYAGVYYQTLYQVTIWEHHIIHPTKTDMVHPNQHLQTKNPVINKCLCISLPCLELILLQNAPHGHGVQHHSYLLTKRNNAFQATEIYLGTVQWFTCIYFMMDTNHTRHILPTFHLGRLQAMTWSCADSKSESGVAQFESWISEDAFLALTVQIETVR